MADPTDKEKAPAAPPQGGRPAVLIMAILAALVVGGAGSIFVMLKQMPAHNAPPPTGKGGAANVVSEAEHEAPPPASDGTVVTMQPLVVNLIDETGDQRYLKVTLALDISAEAASVFEKRTPQLRNALLMTLGNLKTNQVLGAQNKRTLMEQLRKDSATVLGRSNVHELYLTEFVIQ